jgi:putative chitinase
MLLKRGSRGDEVKKLQDRLGLKSDGDFGPRTEEGVKTFQRNNNLPVTGVVNVITWNALFPSPVQKNVIDVNQLTGLISPDVIKQIPLVIDLFKINTPLRVSHFLAQCAQESWNFREVYENLNYGAKALRTVFPRYFTTDAMAAEYARQPEKIANYVYDDANRSARGKLGNTSPGDGWRYRGRGFIQLTGKNNYAAFNRFVDEDVVANPDLVATKYPLVSAGWFWDITKLNATADKGSSEADVRAVTLIVNGGTHGLPARINYFNRFHDRLK